MQQAILFFDRNRFDYFESVSGRILSFPFDAQVLSALEVVNPAGFDAQIQAFIDQNSILPASIVVILSPNVLFEKDIQVQDPQQQEMQAQEFLDNVPFDSLITKLIPFDQGIRIVSTNKALFDIMKTAFEKKGFIIEAIAPYEALGPELYQMSALDAQNAALVFKMYGALKNNSFPILKVQEKPQPTGEKSPNEKPKTNKTTLYAMIGVFVILIIVLIFVILNQS